MLFRIYEYYQDGKGKEVSKFLWGLYYHQKQKDLNRIEVGFLFTYLKEKETFQLSFLKGLLGYQPGWSETPDENSSISLFPGRRRKRLGNHPGPLRGDEFKPGGG